MIILKIALFLGSRFNNVSKVPRLEKGQMLKTTDVESEVRCDICLILHTASFEKIGSGNRLLTTFKVSFQNIFQINKCNVFKLSEMSKCCLTFVFVGN